MNSSPRSLSVSGVSANLVAFGLWKKETGASFLFQTQNLRISNKYGSLTEQIPYEKCHYFEITLYIFKIHIASEVSN
jgi:hypothetical protein